MYQDYLDYLVTLDEQCKKCSLCFHIELGLKRCFYINECFFSNHCRFTENKKKGK